ETHTDPTTKPDPNANTKTNTEPDTKTNTKTETETDTKSDAKSDTETETEPDTKSDAKSDTETETESDAKSDAETYLCYERSNSCVPGKFNNVPQSNTWAENESGKDSCDKDSANSSTRCQS